MRLSQTSSTWLLLRVGFQSSKGWAYEVIHQQTSLFLTWHDSSVSRNEKQGNNQTETLNSCDSWYKFDGVISVLGRAAVIGEHLYPYTRRRLTVI